MLEENGSSLHKFNLVIPMEQDDKLSTLVTRSERLVELKNDFINENRLHVAKMLKPILEDKFQGKYTCVPAKQ